MRFMGDPNLNGAQENLFGNYIIQKGLSKPELRDEILAQVANQVSWLHFLWKKNTKKEIPNLTLFHKNVSLIIFVRCGEILTF